MEAILAAVQGPVQCLGVGGEHTQRITTHFVGLQELQLSVLKVAAKHLWIALGPTLKSLSIRMVMPDVYKKAMRNIQAFCQKLTSVEIGFDED